MSLSKYKISRKAHFDLDNIWLYTFQNWSKTQADAYYNFILSQVDLLVANHFLGKIVELNKKKYRIFPAKPHLIFYRKNPQQPLEVIRILHKRMKLNKHL